MYAPIKILIVDDHKIFRDGLQLLLSKQKDLHIVGEAENGKEVLEKIPLYEPEVLLLDIQMPVMNGIELTKQLQQSHPHIGVIALTMFNEDNLIVDMLEAGARGYLLKNTNKEEVITATKTVYSGETYYCSATSQKLAKLIASSKFNPYRHKPKPMFSDKEIQIMQLICQQYASKEIASLLNMSVRTVEHHRENLQEKTGARNMVGIAMYAIKNGIFHLDS